MIYKEHSFIDSTGRRIVRRTNIDDGEHEYIGFAVMTVHGYDQGGRAVQQQSQIQFIIPDATDVENAFARIDKAAEAKVAEMQAKPKIFLPNN